jgi:hypothetical protein
MSKTKSIEVGNRSTINMEKPVDTFGEIDYGKGLNHHYIDISISTVGRGISVLINIRCHLSNGIFGTCVSKYPFSLHLRDN